MLLGDVAGKGVPAALLMAVTTTLIQAQAQLLSSPAEVLGAANVELHPKMRPPGSRQRLFVTAVYGVLDSVRGEVRLANAGQVPPIHWPAAGEPRYLRLSGLPLGARPASTYGEDGVSLAPGDRLVLCSDGLIEQHDAGGSPVGYAGFLRRLSGLGGLDAEDLIEVLFQEGVQDHPLDRDDRTLVLITAIAPAK